MARRIKIVDKIQQDTESQAKDLSVIDKTNQYVEEAVDGYDGTKIKYVPTPNFTDCVSSGTLLPINMVSETVNTLSRLKSKFGNLTEYVQRELGYNSPLGVCMAFSSEQVDALVMIIEQIKKDKAFILGDMAGIGKGRVVAGVQRWCIKNKFIPVFVTYSSSLFSEMYKDVMDIHGLGELAKGNFVPPSPFILNNNTDPDASIRDEKNNVIQEPLSAKEVKEICRSARLPRDYNCVWMTYSQIFQSRKERGSEENVKHNFINAIAPKSVFIFDESHTAATGDNTIIGLFSKQLIANAKGALFASATYAKFPKAFGLYAIKTSLSEAQIPIQEIEKAISIGGDNVSEYIASAMVKDGQMIRRMRSYQGCKFDTVYRPAGVEIETAKLEVYRVFDEATKQFRDLLDYLKTDAFKAAVNNAVIRAVNEYSEDNRMEIELVEQEMWNTDVAKTIMDDNIRPFLRINNGKYLPKIDYDTIGKIAKYQFKENLFLAIKARLTADTVIKELQTQQEVKYIDGKVVNTNKKPIIAIRSTLETVLNKVDSGNGELLRNDFSEYAALVIRGCEVGDEKISLMKMCPEYFIYSELSERQKQAIEISNISFLVRNEDFADGGALLATYKNAIEGASSNIPLSTIDYLVDRIQSVARPDWDAINPERPENKNPSKYYVVGEVTGRTKVLKKVDGGWKVERRVKDPIKTTFNGYNSGMIDVMILNAAGATGQSAQSSIKFPDQRPRIMFILQPELNINTEVQKRGRIHRTGQVNLPSYTYIISLVPAEIRTLVSLRNKLRKLDANVSANQVQSSDMVDIKDSKNKPIEDIYNKYGVEAFATDFINNPDNDEFHEIYQRDVIGMGNYLFADESTLEKFSREMDYQRSELQESFYDQMNEKYREVVDKHIYELKDYQLELDTENLKASIKSRVIVALGEGDSEFSKPLFMEDKYTLELRKTLTKAKIEAKITEFCGGERPDKWHNDFIARFQREYQNYIEGIIERRIESTPISERYPDDESYEQSLEDFRQRLQTRREELNGNMRRLSNRNLSDDNSTGSGILDFFVPGKKIIVPDYVLGWEEGFQGEEEEVEGEESGKKKKKKKGEGEEEEGKEKKKDVVRMKKEDDESSFFRIPARFIGYKLLGEDSEKAGNKYGDSSIELHFALLSGAPILKLKPSKNSRALAAIIEASDWLNSWGTDILKAIDDWKFDPNKRYVRRFLSGNILSAIARANVMQASIRDNEGKRIIRDWGLIRYTNFDGTVSTGIKLDYGRAEDVTERYGNLFSSKLVKNEDGEDEFEESSNMPVTVPCVNERVVEYISMIPAVWTPAFYASGVAPLMKGLIKVVRPERESDIFQLHIYTATTGRKKEGKVVVETEVSKPNYNKYYFDETLANILRPRFSVTAETFVDVEGVKKIDRARYLSAKVYIFNFALSSHIEIFKRAMKYLWDKDRLQFTFKNDVNEYYSISEREDEFVEGADNKNTEKLFELGEYEYMRTAPAEANGSIPSELIVSESEGTGSYGSVTLNLPLLPNVAITYKVYPKNLANDVAVKLYLSLFGEQERARIVKELGEKIKEKKTKEEIGFWAAEESRQYIPELKYIFGSKNIPQIGEILKVYGESGDISKLNYEVKEDIVSKAERKIKETVDMAGAQQYLINMLS